MERSDAQKRVIRRYVGLLKEKKELEDLPSTHPIIEEYLGEELVAIENRLEEVRERMKQLNLIH